MERTRQKYLAALMFVCMTAMLPTVGSHEGAGHNYYISLLLAAVVFLPFFFMVLRLSDICGIDEDIFSYFGKRSKFMGKIIACIFSAYALITACTTLRAMGEEIRNLALFNTPMLYIFAFGLIVYVYAINKGYQVHARFSALYAPIVIAGIIAYTVLSISRYEFGNLERVFVADLKSIALSGAKSISGLWGDCLLLLFVIGKRTEKEGYEPFRKRYFIVSYATAFTVIFSTVLNSILVLGGSAVSKLYFPHYISASLINLGFISRLEIVMNVLFFIEMNIKVIFSLYCASEGVKYVIGSEKVGGNGIKSIAVPVFLCVLVCTVTAYTFSSTREFFIYLEYYRAYGVIMFAVLVLLWIIAEFIERKRSIAARNGGRLNTMR